MKSKKLENNKAEPSVRAQTQESDDVWDAVNNYGTYNIQPTADTDHMYPAIAQGFNAMNIQTDMQNEEAEKKTQKLDK